MHSAPELVSQIEALTSLPTVYERIRAQLESPRGSVLEVSRLISADPALTARLLRLVNSAMYAHSGTIDSVSRAVHILGLQQVHDLVLAMSLNAVFAGIRPDCLDMNAFWRGSVMRGLLTRAIALRTVPPASERLFVIGLLADIGHLVLYQTVPALAAEARLAADRDGEPLALAERRIVGCDFAEIGAALTDRWRLPAGFAGAIGAQVLPRLGGEHATPAAMLNLASSVAHADETGEASADLVARLDSAIWDQLGLTPDSVAAIREEAELHLAAYIGLFFPRHAI